MFSSFWLERTPGLKVEVVGSAVMSKPSNASSDTKTGDPFGWVWWGIWIGSSNSPLVGQLHKSDALSFEKLRFSAVAGRVWNCIWWEKALLHTGIFASLFTSILIFLIVSSWFLALKAPISGHLTMITWPKSLPFWFLNLYLGRCMGRLHHLHT